MIPAPSRPGGIDRLRRLPRGVGVVAVAIAFALGPALLHPGRTVVGSPTVDGYGTQWFYWFAGEILGGRQSAGWTDRLFFPWGKDVYAHTGGNLVDALLAWPLRAGLGPVAGFDLWVVLVLVSNAWAGVRLAAAWGVPAGRRWPAALALVLNPYVLAELDFGRPTQAWLAPAGLAVAALVGMGGTGRASGGEPARGVRGAGVAGFWLAVTALAYWYYGLLLAGLAVLHAAWRVAFGPGRLRAVGLHAIAAGVALLGTVPFAAKMFAALAAGAVPGLLALDGTGPIAPLALRTVEGDAQGLYVVAPLTLAAGSLLDDGGLRFNPGVPALFAVHVFVAGLGLWALFGRRDRGAAGTERGIAGAAAAPRWGWVVPGLGLALVIAAGPVILHGDGFTVNRPWLALVTRVDLLRRWWWPGRAVMVVHLLLAPLVALGLAALAPRWRGVTAVCLALATLVPLRREALLPIGSWDASVPTTLACLAAAPDGAVIDVPLLVDQKNLWYQTVHGKPLLGGMLLKKVAFAPPEVAALQADNGLLRELATIGEHQYTRGAGVADPTDRAALIGLGYRYVLARADAFGHARVERDGHATVISDWPRARRLLVALLGAPAAEDEALGLWTLDNAGVACP